MNDLRISANEDPGMDHRIPPEFASLDAALAGLAAVERSLMPEALPARIGRATLPVLMGVVAGEGAPTEPLARLGPGAGLSVPRRALALAASLALVATVGTAWLAGNAPDGAGSIADADLDAWLASPELLDMALGDSIHDAAADADEIARAVGGTWMPDDLFYSDESAEESM